MRRIVFRENERVGQWIEDNGGGQYRAGSQCIGLECNGELVAGVLYDYHNDASIYTHIAVANKRAVNRAFLYAIFAYPFNQLKCRVLLGLVAGDNRGSQLFVEHLGFRLEHTIADADPSGDLRIYTMRRNECRWINHEDHH